MFNNKYPSYGGFKDYQHQSNRANTNNRQVEAKPQSTLIPENNQIDMSNVVTEIIEDNRLIIGTNDKKKDIYIAESSRYFNTLVLGLKGTGKTSEVLPMFVEQDFKNKKVGSTIIVTKKEMAYSLYTLAKMNKRKVRLLKPSINNEISNKLLWQTNYSYDYINEFIINYKEAIKKKEIVIIDMEILKYKSEGLRAVAMLLLQLQLDIQETDITHKTPHYLYVDDAFYFLPFLEHLLNFSDDYNLGITLFMQSRNQFIKNNKDYTHIIDNNIRTTLLLNSLNLKDVKYYTERFYEHNTISNFYSRKPNSFMYETLDYANKRKCGVAEFSNMDKEKRSEIESKSKKNRNKLLKEKRLQRENQLRSIIRERDAIDINEESLEYSEQDLLKLKEKETENNKSRNTSNKPKIDYKEYDELGEPKPFDLDCLDELDDTNEEINIETTNCNEEINNGHYEDEFVCCLEDSSLQSEIKPIKQADIKEMIYMEEKETKRKVSSNIFNKLNSDIDYCNDSFDFQFD